MAQEHFVFVQNAYKNSSNSFAVSVSHCSAQFRLNSLNLFARISPTMARTCHNVCVSLAAGVAVPEVEKTRAEAQRKKDAFERKRHVREAEDERRRRRAGCWRSRASAALSPQSYSCICIVGGAVRALSLDETCCRLRRGLCNNR